MVKNHKKGGRMRDTSQEQAQHQQELNERAYANNDDNTEMNIDPENMDDSFMSSDAEDNVIESPQPIHHYIDLAYISNPNNMMIEPLLVFNEYYTRILTDENVMTSLAEDNSLGYIADDLLRIMTYAPSERTLTLMTYYLTDEREMYEMLRYPPITVRFLEENRDSFITRSNEVANVLRHEETQMPENELMGGKYRYRIRRKKRTRKNIKKRFRTRRNNHKLRK